MDLFSALEDEFRKKPLESFAKVLTLLLLYIWSAFAAADTIALMVK